ncbi:MAG: tagaturonate reductase [Bacteroidota bacterium]
MTLNRDLVLAPATQARTDLQVPSRALLDLPERIVQFGTGGFLRGFADDFIDKANRAKANRAGAGIGRAVVVSQTGSGRAAAFNEQDGLYTLLVRGIDQGQPVEATRVIGAVSRAVSARDDWNAVLDLARRPEVSLVVSNTTEVGIRWDEADDVHAAPPSSFPAKLTAFLFARAETFKYTDDGGLVVLPCELIEQNGDTLRTLVHRWAERGGLGDDFMRWVERTCVFPNTLVDRIVPGSPDPAEAAAIREQLGYDDALLTTCEVYRLFAIQAPDGDTEALCSRLGFADADPGVVVTDDVEPYRLRKVRLLNGTHTLMVPVALGCGLATVEEAVTDARVGAFVQQVMIEELAVATESELAEVGEQPGTAEPFARAVLDRFRNPYIRHEMVQITLQQTMKLGVRVAPAVERYHAATGRPPEGIALGVAAMLLLHRAAAGLDGQHFPGLDVTQLLRDDRADTIRAAWARTDARDPNALEALTETLLADARLWDMDLTRVPGFADAVARHLVHAHAEGLPAAVDALLAGVVGQGSPVEARRS